MGQAHAISSLDFNVQGSHTKKEVEIAKKQ